MRNVAMRRKKTGKSAPDEMAVADEEAAAYLKDVELRFRTLLSPAEAYIMGIQSTLAWEIPSFSGCVFIAVNIVFWLATRMRFYHLLGLTGLTVVFVDIWIHKIWPEIRVPPSPEEREEWTLVHPKLLSVPEISRHLARLWITISGALHWLIILRCTSHAKFFVVMMLVLIVIGVVGLYISSITLLYIIVMSVFIIPPLIYHNMLSELYTTLEPTILRMEKIFNVKRTRSKKSKKKGGEVPVVDGGTASDSDEGLEEFVPQPDTEAGTLAKATSNESEEDSSGHTPGLLTPEGLSQGGPSRDISDTESLGDETTNFAKGLRAIPDFDDSRLDDSLNFDDTNMNDEMEDLDVSNGDDTDILPADPIPEIEAEQPVVTASESMHFISGHFKDSSESDPENMEGELASGLAFPDIQDELDNMAKEESSSHAAVASEMVTKTMSSLMTSTMSGLSMLGEKASKLGETVRAAAKSATSGETEPLPETETETDSPAQPPEGDSAAVVPPGGTLRKTITESTDSDILAEFEFLDQEDLNVSEDEDTNKEPPAASTASEKKAEDQQPASQE